MTLTNKILNKLTGKIAVLLLPKIKQLIQDEINFSNHNLKYSMQQIASKEAAEFVIENIPINLNFDDRYALLAHCSKKIQEFNEEKSGAILEFGVWKGSTINFMAKLLPDMEFFGFDSFEGLSEPWMFNDKGAFGDLDAIPEVEKNVNLIKGYFSETLPPFISTLNSDVKLIHIDCDLYSSTVTVLENISLLLKPGVIVVFDEFFNYPGWKNGEFKAWSEFISRSNLRYEYIGYTYQKNSRFRSGQQVAVQIC